jgi:hypothetical protein
MRERHVTFTLSQWKEKFELSIYIYTASIGISSWRRDVQKLENYLLYMQVA